MPAAKITHSIRILFAVVVGVLLAGPLFYLVANSLMTASQTSDLTPQLIPHNFDLQFGNYTAALSLSLIHI